MSRNEDVERYLAFFDDAVKEKKLKEYKIYSKSRGKIKLLAAEDDEWEEVKEAKECLKDLSKQIMLKNRNNHSGMIEALEQKYGQKKGSSKNKEYELDDGAFEKLQAELFNKKDRKKMKFD